MKSFEQVFIQRLDSIIQRGEQVGMTLTHICRETGIARATPDRWRKEAPKTIALLDKMEAAVAAAEAGRHEPV